MNLRLTSLLFLLACFCTSCYTPGPVVRRYAPAFSGTVFTYIPKPTSFDSLKSANYISAGYANALQRVTDKGLEDEARFANLSLSRSHLLKNANLAYGVDGFAGSFHNTTIAEGEPDYFKNKSVFGLQFKASANHYLPLKKMELRPIGIDFSYSREFGDFKDFRQTISSKKKLSGFS